MYVKPQKTKDRKSLTAAQKKVATLPAANKKRKAHNVETDTHLKPSDETQSTDPLGPVQNKIK
jgi:hypothetical protein